MNYVKGKNKKFLEILPKTLFFYKRFARFVSCILFPLLFCDGYIFFEAQKPPSLHPIMLSHPRTNLPLQKIYFLLFWFTKYYISEAIDVANILLKEKRSLEVIQIQVGHYCIQFCTSFKWGVGGGEANNI
jgi:hypothetical protein